MQHLTGQILCLTPHQHHDGLFRSNRAELGWMDEWVLLHIHTSGQQTRSQPNEMKIIETAKKKAEAGI